MLYLAKPTIRNPFWHWDFWELALESRERSPAMSRLSFRELLLLAVTVAVVLGWGIDHYRQSNYAEQQEETWSNIVERQRVAESILRARVGDYTESPIPNPYGPVPWPTALLPESR
jgi:hypothetical protein